MDMKNTYLPRIADAKLTLALQAMGAVLIEGPKCRNHLSLWCWPRRRPLSKWRTAYGSCR